MYFIYVGKSNSGIPVFPFKPEPFQNVAFTVDMCKVSEKRRKIGLDIEI